MTYTEIKNNKIKNTYMVCTANGSNKWYQCSINGAGSNEYVVLFSYGAIGRTQAEGQKVGPVSMEDAEKAYNKLVSSKLKKSYIIQTVSGAPDLAEIRLPAGSLAPEKTQTGLRCQLLTPIEEGEVERYLSDPAYCAQEKFDGQRKMYKYEYEGVISINRKGLVVSGSKPVADAINDLIAWSDAEKAIIDGEEIGGTYYIFDLLAMDIPYSERYDILKGLMEGNTSSALKLVPIARSEAEKRNLIKRLREAGHEGIVFKRMDSMYTSGRNMDQIKFKFYETASCVVEGLNKKSSIKLKMLDESGNYVSVGNCTVAPSKGLPKVGEVVEIKYLYAYRGGSLYQPAYLGVRDDIDASECTLSQLKYKSTDSKEIQVEDTIVKRKINWK